MRQDPNDMAPEINPKPSPFYCRPFGIQGLRVCVFGSGLVNEPRPIDPSAMHAGGRRDFPGHNWTSSLARRAKCWKRDVCSEPHFITMHRTSAHVHQRKDLLRARRAGRFALDTASVYNRISALLSASQVQQDCGWEGEAAFRVADSPVPGFAWAPLPTATT